VNGCASANCGELVTFEDREEGKTIKEEGMQAIVGKECGMRG
jgi:hypothetical protein